ncbi:MAG: hypothetical protein HUU38_15560 [Anaerolineales bacterium]|nr:hypothetical protein [Anaerolineales bacterium]
MPYQKPLPVSQLILDIQNPRLPDNHSNQLNAIKNMVNIQADKILALAEHFVNNGPNPASLPIVMPSLDDEDIYVVLDGNRRLTALRLLGSSHLRENLLIGSQAQKFQKLSQKFEQNPISNLLCVVVKDRDEADVWIQLLHRGQQQGAGLVEWDGQVAARYDARKNRKSNSALEILDFVKEQGQLSKKTIQRINDGKFPITNLERLINTPYVRKKLGIETTNDGNVLVTHSGEDVLKGLNRVIDDLGTSKVTVSKIKSQEQRIDYVNNLSADELPVPEKILPTPLPLENLSINEQSGKGNSLSSTGDKAKRIPKIRSTLIPRECIIKIQHHRISKIFQELKRLNVDEFPNASAVMLRVFVELSLDHYLESVIKWKNEQVENSKLAQKLTAIINHFEANNLLTSSQLAPIKKAAGGQTLLAASVKTMHGYVHNRHSSPIPSELKIAWDDIQLFLETLWK